MRENRERERCGGPQLREKYGVRESLGPRERRGVRERHVVKGGKEISKNRGSGEKRDLSREMETKTVMCFRCGGGAAVRGEDHWH